MLGLTYNAWVAAVARKEFTIASGLAMVDTFEKEHGGFGPDELEAAEQWAAEVANRAKRTGTRRPRRA